MASLGWVGKAAGEVVLKRKAEKTQVTEEQDTLKVTKVL